MINLRWGLAGFQRVRPLRILTCQCAICIIEEKTRSPVSFMRNLAVRKTDRCVFYQDLVRDKMMCSVQDHELGEDLHSFRGYKHVNGYVKTPKIFWWWYWYWKNCNGCEIFDKTQEPVEIYLYISLCISFLLC